MLLPGPSWAEDGVDQQRLPRRHVSVLVRCSRTSAPVRDHLFVRLCMSRLVYGGFVIYMYLELSHLSYLNAILNRYFYY